ncbi:MAG: hypothetical protein LUI06_03040 [Ruminococcus sp.]|nr:hypothetical protein [Ruminococcus sp.]
MKSFKKKLVSLGVAMVMASSCFSVGAGAVSIDKTKSYSCTHYRISALATLNTSTKKAYVRNLTSCRVDCAVLYAQVKVGNTAEKHSEMEDAEVGDILTPNVTINSYSGKTAKYISYYKASASGGEKSKKTFTIELTT